MWNRSPWPMIKACGCRSGRACRSRSWILGWPAPSAGTARHKVSVATSRPATLLPGLLAFRRKADAGRECDPVRVLARDIAAEDQVHREAVDRAPAQADLDARLDEAPYLGLAELAEHFGRQRPDIVGRAPVEPGAVGEVVPVGDAVPRPAGVDVDPHHVREPQRRRDVGEVAGHLVADHVVDRAAGERDAEAPDRARHEIGFELRRDRRAPFAVGAEALDLRAELDRAPEVDDAGGIGDGEEILVARPGEPGLDLAVADVADLRGVDAVGCAGRLGPGDAEQRQGQRNRAPRASAQYAHVRPRQANRYHVRGAGAAGEGGA